ncbi:MAG: hypothetical protein HC812_09105 [Leptolyngbya sp. RL_3_1]|nr:hypothetical protein [Leptolyngbya sp. RL_3_1]
MGGDGGDEQAIVRLLSQTLTPLEAQVAAERKDSTLHLVVTGQTPGSSVPDEAAITQAIAAVLERLAPQGLQRAMIYGQPDGRAHPELGEMPQSPGVRA